MDIDEAIERFERRRRAWLAQDVEAYLALWAEDMTFGSPLHPESLRGRAAYEELVRMSLDLIRPIRFDVHALATNGDTVLSEWESEFEWRATGAHTTYRGMAAATIEDGLIKTWREYWNPQDLAPS